MALSRVQLKNFTAFAELDLELSPGINVLVGANGTGKTHLMKVCYAACDVSRTGMSFTDKLVQVFLPSQRRASRFVQRQQNDVNAEVTIFQNYSHIGANFDDKSVGSSQTGGRNNAWSGTQIEGVYIPVKEMLSNAPGFRSLYAKREIHFEAVYADILDRAYLPALRELPSDSYKRLVDCLQDAIGGRVAARDSEEFFLEREGFSIEFTLLAEGIRKIALLLLLIENGSLQKGSVLFWDEPETNLNPKLYAVVMEVLLELQRSGVQIFIATHDYGILKELDLSMEKGDEVAFHSLYHDETGEIACNTARSYLGISPNAIAEALDDFYDRQIERSLGNFGR